MRLAVISTKANDGSGKFIARVDYLKGDGIRFSEPNSIKYGNTKRDAESKLKESLNAKGHTII